MFTEEEEAQGCVKEYRLQLIRFASLGIHFFNPFANMRSQSELRAKWPHTRSEWKVFYSINQVGFGIQTIYVASRLFLEPRLTNIVSA